MKRLIGAAKGVRGSRRAADGAGRAEGKRRRRQELALLIT
jgi:hypothetical protein